MSVSAAAVLSVMLAHPAYSDRQAPSEEREFALRPVAEAIASAARTSTEAAELLALGMHESHFALAVVRDGCRGMGDTACDSRKARGPWQLHREACRAAWAFDQGSVESTRVEARCAVALLRGYEAHCGSLGGAYAMYGTGHSCSFRGSAARVATTFRFTRELSR